MLCCAVSCCAVLCCAVLQDEGVAARVQALLSTPRFRCYRTTDVTGVELGGALKNVLAIACGEWAVQHCQSAEPQWFCV
jgi:glycerol-3-phosphate dehydrogenase